MKHISILAFFLPFFGLGQVTDTSCIKSRWIALKPISANGEIFLLDSTHNETLGLLYTVKILAEENKLKLYKQNDGPQGLNGWYYLDYNKVFENNLKDSVESHNKGSYFEIAVQANHPMLNHFGEDSIQIMSDGTMSFVYPEPEVYIFPAAKCDEIRIKENRKYNEKTKSYEYVPIAMSFYLRGNKYARGHEKFWIDLNEFFSELDSKTKYPWYDAIKNRHYQGFQYMQVSCYDDEIEK